MKYKAEIIRILGEFCATAMLMVLMPATCIKDLFFANNLLQSAFGCGFAVATCIECFGCISGAHLNPAVSIANCILGYMSLPMLGFYLLAQTFGALFGYGLFAVILPWEMVKGSPCLTVPHPSIQDGHTFGIEFIATATLVLYCCSVWDPRNASSASKAVVSLKFGFLITFVVLFGGYETGASINPVRTLAPAVFHSTYTKIWIYFLSQVLASVSMAYVWRFIFAGTAEKATSEAE